MWIAQLAAALISIAFTNLSIAADIHVCSETENATQEIKKIENIELTLENLFENDKLFGKTPSDLAWSYDSSLLAYRWNIFEATGYDIWLYDTKTKTTRALTTVETFAPFEEDAYKIIRRPKEKTKRRQR